ncbi:TniQ family protein [Pseudoroseomonas cervicalis]|uniref:TniQ family protein n=1 Tax=Teichococcus cervicalis TaxID=204525 RepID=UPI0022F16D99|nr:TniQ family protein [Pseudoroseomonas cervicalis]WBV42530.1 TniQ family protein [Pseudoroseomonas cervicalis]
MPRPYTLPNASIPHDDESLASLVFRNAARYRFKDPMLIVERLGLHKQSLPALGSKRPPEDAAAALAALLDVDEDTLEIMSNWGRSPNMATVGGHEIRPRHLHAGLRRSCPLCLQDSPHHRSFWNVAAVQHCTVHGIPLPVRCPGCKRPPTWRGKRLDLCGNPDCDYDLAGWSGPTNEPAPAYALGLHALYRAGPSATLPGCGLPLGRAAEAALAIGGFALNQGKMGRPDSFLRAHGGLAHEAMIKGWEALTDWPHGLHRVLDGLRGRAGGRGWRFGMRREFGGLHRWLYDAAAEPWAATLKEGFADYLAGQPDVRASAAALKRFGSPEALRNRHMTANDAAEYLGVAPETMADLAVREKLHLVSPSGAGAPTLLRADLVHALKERKQDTLMKQEAEAILGMGRPTLRQLLEDGVLTTLPAEKRVTHQRILLREEVEDLLRRVLEAVVPANESAQLISFAGAMAGRRDASTLIQAVLAGRVVPRGKALRRKGINSLLFDGREVEAALAPGRATMSLVEAAQRMGTDIESVRAWAAEGFLTIAVSTSPHEQGSRVTDDGIAAFVADYVTSIEVGKQAGTSGRWAAERLEFQGHPPLPSASITKLYRRGDVTPAVVASLRERKSAGRAESAAAAFGLAREVADAVASELGADLQRSWNGFANAGRGIYLQVVAGRRQRYSSKYAFRFSGHMRAQLDRAGTGLLALALVEERSFVLLPWSAAQQVVPSGGRYRETIYIDADARGVVQDEQLAAVQRWLQRS